MELTFLIWLLGSDLVPYIPIPYNYTTHYIEGIGWSTENEFVMELGIPSEVPDFIISYSFANSTLLNEDSENMYDILKNTQDYILDFIKVTVAMSMTDNWMEIQDIEYLSQYYSGAEAYEPSLIFIGTIDYASKLKEILENKYNQKTTDYDDRNNMMYGSESHS